MRKLKAAIIGAGSTYTPELIEGFVKRRETLDFETFYLMDINEKSLEIVGGLAKRMLEATGFKGEIVLTTDFPRAIDGADYIFGQIRVGQMAARIRDEKIPLKYGLLGQETTGAGGFMNALRTVPVMLDLAEKIEKYSPDAWLINFSNPSGIVAEALLNHTKVKTIGLCNCPVNMLKEIETTIGSNDFEYDYVGLNHLSWITSVTQNGESVLGGLKKDGSVMKNVPSFEYGDDLMKAIPAIPTSYLSYFYLREKQLKKCLEAEQTRGEICAGLEKDLMEQYKNPNLNVKPAELEKRGGALYSTAAVSVVDAIENDKQEYHVVDVKNNGTLDFLDDNDVIEAKCKVGRDGAVPVKITAKQNDYIVGLIQAVKAYERLTVKAAMSGSRADALAAMMVHPLIGDYDRAKACLDDMIEANIDYLPKFK